MLPRKALAVSRPAGGSLDRATGKFTAGTPTSITIYASVQPLTPKQMEALPEGRRKRAAYHLFTDTLLRTVDDQNPDRVALEDGVYEVVAVAGWQNGILSHYDATVSRMETQP